MFHDGQKDYAAIRAYAWSVIKKELGNFNLPKNWSTLYASNSVTVSNRKKGCFVKITTEGEVFLDERLPNFEFKSEKYKHDKGIEASAKGFINLIQMYSKIYP